MEKKRVMISGPLAIAGITLILVIKLSVNCQPAGNNIVFSGVKQPVSLVVKSPWTNKAFNLDGNEVPLSAILEDIPALASMLE